MSDQALTLAEATETWAVRLCDFEGTRPLGRFLISHGEMHQGAPLPDDVPPAAPRTCFASSQQYLARSGRTDLFYAEGIACSPRVGIGLPIPHGWLVDRSGRVVDRVWDDAADSAYLGVVFRTEYVLDRVLELRLWGSILDCPRDKWSVLRGRTPLGQVLADWRNP